MITADEARATTIKGKMTETNRVSEKYIETVNFKIEEMAALGYNNCYWYSDNVNEVIYPEVKKIVIKSFEDRGFKISIRKTEGYNGLGVKIKVKW